MRHDRYEGMVRSGRWEGMVRSGRCERMVRSGRWEGMVRSGRCEGVGLKQMTRNTIVFMIDSLRFSKNKTIKQTNKTKNPRKTNN